MHRIEQDGHEAQRDVEQSSQPASTTVFARAGCRVGARVREQRPTITNATCNAQATKPKE
jgi:hypothetical protein